jgi:hypothetical protein
VDGDDVRVIERRGGARLLLEACEVVGRGGDAIGEELDRHFAPEPGVARAPDLPHAAGTDRCQQPEAPDGTARFERHGGLSLEGR